MHTTFAQHVQANRNFMAYSGGIFNDPTCVGQINREHYGYPLPILPHGLLMLISCSS